MTPIWPYLGTLISAIISLYLFVSFSIKKNIKYNHMGFGIISLGFITSFVFSYFFSAYSNKMWMIPELLILCGLIILTYRLLGIKNDK